MKVIQINAVYNLGSTGRTTAELHNALLNNGIESYVAYSKTNKPDDKNLYHIGSSLDVKLHGLFSRISGKQAYFSHLATRDLIKFIDKINPDVVHLRNLHGNYINLPMLMKYLADKKISVVITFHDFWFITGKCMHFISSDCSKWQERCGNCPNLQDGNRTWFFDKTEELLKDKIQMFSKIDKLALIGVSKWTTSQIEKSPIARYADIVKLIYNWIDLDVFKPINADDIREKYNLTDKKILLGVSNIWNNKKGLDTFLGISNLLKDDEIIMLVGNKPNIDLPKNIISVPTTESVNELVKYYNAADVFLQLSKEETFGKVVAEALACGTPVVTNSYTANPELVNTSCGCVVSDLSADTVYSSIEAVLNNGKKSYSDACIKFAKENFDSNKNMGEYLKLYSDLSTEKSNGN